MYNLLSGAFIQFKIRGSKIRRKEIEETMYTAAHDSKIPTSASHVIMFTS